MFFVVFRKDLKDKRATLKPSFKIFLCPFQKMTSENGFPLDSHISSISPSSPTEAECSTGPDWQQRHDLKLFQTPSKNTQCSHNKYTELSWNLSSKRFHYWTQRFVASCLTEHAYVQAAGQSTASVRDLKSRWVLGDSLEQRGEKMRKLRWFVVNVVFHMFEILKDKATNKRLSFMAQQIKID